MASWHHKRLAISHHSTRCPNDDGEEKDNQDEVNLEKHDDEDEDDGDGDGDDDGGDDGGGVVDDGDYGGEEKDNQDEVNPKYWIYDDVGGVDWDEICLEDIAVDYVGDGRYGKICGRFCNSVTM